MRAAPAPLRTAPSRRARAAALGVALVLAGGGLAGCAGKRPSLGAIAPTTTGSTTSVPASTTTEPSAPAGTAELGPDDLLGYIATPKADPQVFRSPEDDSTPIEVPAKTEAGAPTTFAIVGDASPTATLPHPGWYEVALPTRPNRAIGYVRTASVAVTKTDLRLKVDLEGRTLTVEREGAEVFQAPIAIGTEDNPTPTGATYVTELIKNVNPSGSYGPFAFGLALHSDTLTEFAGGDGQVGIHGTNKPKLIGSRVSHGCVRLNNDDVRKLVDLQLPLGVPVFIT